MIGFARSAPRRCTPGPSGTGGQYAWHSHWHSFGWQRSSRRIAIRAMLETPRLVRTTRPSSIVEMAVRTRRRRFGLWVTRIKVERVRCCTWVEKVEDLRRCSPGPAPPSARRRGEDPVRSRGPGRWPPAAPPPRELVRESVRAAAQARPRPGARPPCGRARPPGCPKRPHRELDVLARGQGREKIESLEDEPDPLKRRRASLPVRGQGHGPSVPRHRARRRNIEETEQVEEGRLPAARWALDGDELPRRRSQVDPVQGADILGALRPVDLPHARQAELRDAGGRRDHHRKASASGNRRAALVAAAAASSESPRTARTTSIKAMGSKTARFAASCTVGLPVTARIRTTR